MIAARGLMFFLLVSVSACSNTATVFPKAVQQRAAFDLSCEEQKILVQNLGGDTYGAVGCEKKASYACICGYHVMGDCTKPVCTLDSESRPVEGPPSAGPAAP